MADEVVVKNPLDGSYWEQGRGDDDRSGAYIDKRRDANAPSSMAWKSSRDAGMDPGDVVLDKPVYDAIETRTDGKSTFRVGVDNERPENSAVLEVMDFVEDVGEGAVDVVVGGVKGAVQGVALAGKEIGDALTDGYWSSHITPFMRENIPYLDDANKALDEAIKPVGGVQEVTAAIASPLTQVIAPGALFTRAFRVAGYGRALAEFMGYSAAEVLAMSPEETTLMELGLQLIDDDPEVQTILEEAFAAQTSESDFMARVKNMPRRVLEGGGIGVVTERSFQAIGMAYRALKNSPAFKEGARRFAEGKSPIPMGLSIEDVSDDAAAAVTKTDEAAPVLDDAGNVIEEAPKKTLTENAIIKEASSSPAERKFGREFLQKFRSKFNAKTGFIKVKLAGGEFSTSKSGKIVFKPKFQEPAYEFHTPPGKMPTEKWAKTLASRTVDRVTEVVARAQGGDQAAKDIIAEASWYRSMRVRLREEFGGIGDVFADALGATSAQTNVKANWKNSIEIMRRFSRGEFDEELVAFAARSEEGLPMDSAKLHKLEKAGEFPLIKNAAGSLFNTNSPAATGALLDLFRTITPGRAPKTPNFTGNLIGYSNDATIDVWAARFLRNIAGKPYIPPGAEKAVAGKHLKKSTQANPKIGSEFGFGQDVFAKAAEDVNNSGLIKNYDDSLGDLGADDLQAVVWFMEKEKWTKNGWTSKIGEGGSLDFEASLAGSPDAGRVGELRTIINAKGTSAEARALAQEELETMKTPLERYVLGVSGERPGDIPSNYRQAEIAAELDDVVRDDPSVITYKLTNTYGRFKKTDERAIDAEFVVRKDFNPAALERRLVEQGKERDQDSVFISKVVPAGSENARPGMEIYFTKGESADFTRQLSDELAQRGIDGFTFITDARQADRVNVQAVAGGADTGTLTGIRMQYIPEFDDVTSPERMIEMEDLFLDLVDKYGKRGSVSVANSVHYDTKVITRGEYDVYLAGTASSGKGTVGGRQPSGANATKSNRGAGAGGVSAGNVSDGQRQGARN